MLTHNLCSLASGFSRLAVLAGTFGGLPAIAVMPTEADRIMTDELRLKIIGCGIPQVTRIQIGAEERYTLDLPGEKRYLYDAGTKKLIDVSTGTPNPPASTSGTESTDSSSEIRKHPQFSLVYGDVVDGTITANSPMQQVSTGAFGQVAVKGRANTFTFAAQQGDQVVVKTTTQGSLKPFLALIAPNGTQVASDSDGNLRYTTTTVGRYKIVVLGDRDTLGAYSLSLAGTPSSTGSSQTGVSAANSRTFAVRAPFNDLERSRIIDAVYRNWSSKVQRVNNITVSNPNYRFNNGTYGILLNVAWIHPQTGRSYSNSTIATIDTTNEIGYTYSVNKQWQKWIWTGQKL
ncbi:MAG: hypothetical protein DCF22_05710 [Leptolyngbya sp.]|nr:MAG: hypothetical protein DCF22_05710 [Leptolyngbya sp.]